MKTEYKSRRSDSCNVSRRNERLRLLGSAIGLWAACASGIYLLGPGDAERIAADSIAPQSAGIAVTAYRP
jgi:hypothetical protein